MREKLDEAKSFVQECLSSGIRGIVVLLFSISIIIGIIALALLIHGVIFTLPFFFAWNYIAPVFSFPVLTYWQSFAITILISTIAGFFRSTSTKKE